MSAADDMMAADIIKLIRSGIQEFTGIPAEVKNFGNS